MLSDLIVVAESHFAAFRPQPWADPRPDRRSPTEDEYSTLDPDKYVIVQQRYRAWIFAAVEAELAETILSQRVLAGWGNVETVELRPSALGTMTMFVHFTGDNLPGVVLALGDPLAVITSVPQCGCDACDSGSEPLMEEIDTVFSPVLLGVAAVERTSRSSRVVLIGQESASTGESGLPRGIWSGSAWFDD